MTLSAAFPHRETVLRLAPILCVDRNEPFDPIRIGVTVFERTARSSSFDRTVVVDPVRTAFIVEYAVYWDYDIQHLYDLEHVWIHVGHDGKIAGCEVSFHGHYLIGLMRDRSNVTEDGRAKVYVQPGKHAMAASEELFRLLPNVESCCMEDAGIEGLLEPEMFRGTFKTGAADDAVSERILRGFAFRPSFEYAPLELSDDVFVAWEELREEIPARMKALLAAHS